MNDHMDVFFRSIEDVLHSGSFRPDSKLKLALARPDNEVRFPCMNLYHAWSIAELCCASPDWNASCLGAICWPSTNKPLILAILQDLFYALKQVEIPSTEGIVWPEIDKRIFLLDTLKRVELAQALRLEIRLYTLDGHSLG